MTRGRIAAPWLYKIGDFGRVGPLAGGDGAGFGGDRFQRCRFAPRAALPWKDGLRLKAGGNHGFQPTAFFFHDQRPFAKCLSFDVETNLTGLSGSDLAPIVKDCEFFRADLAQLWQRAFWPVSP